MSTKISQISEQKNWQKWEKCAWRILIDIYVRTLLAAEVVGKEFYSCQSYPFSTTFVPYNIFPLLIGIFRKKAWPLLVDCRPNKLPLLRGLIKIDIFPSLILGVVYSSWRWRKYYLPLKLSHYQLATCTQAVRTYSIAKLSRIFDNSFNKGMLLFQKSIFGHPTQVHTRQIALRNYEVSSSIIS